MRSASQQSPRPKPKRTTTKFLSKRDGFKSLGDEDKGRFEAKEDCEDEIARPMEREKNQQMMTRIIAIAAALAVSFAVGTSASKAAPIPNPPNDSSAAPNRDLPAEVREFLDRRYECNHVIAAERSRQLRCKELLTDEAALERRYSSNETVLKVLERPLFQRLTASK